MIMSVCLVVGSIARYEGKGGFLELQGRAAAKYRKLAKAARSEQQASNKKRARY